MKNGKSVEERYYSFQPLGPNDEPPNKIVRGILETNAPGAKWKDAEPEGRKEEAAFVTADGKYRAGVFLGLYHPGPTIDSNFAVLVEEIDSTATASSQEEDTQPITDAKALGSDRNKPATTPSDNSEATSQATAATPSKEQIKADNAKDNLLVGSWKINGDETMVCTFTKNHEYFFTHPGEKADTGTWKIKAIV